MPAHLLAALLLFAATGSEPPVVPEPPAVSGKKPKATKKRPVLPGFKKGVKLVVSAEGASRKRLPSEKDGTEVFLVTFTGKVDARRGELKLTCSDMKVTFAKAPVAPGKKARTLSREAIASGSVVVRTPRRKAIAERASYQLQTETLTLSGKRRPVIYQDGDAIAAESFVFHRARGVFEARGKTVAVILPRKKPGEKPDEKLVPPGRGEKAGPSMARRTRIDAAGGAIYEEAARRLFLRKNVLVRQKGLRLSCDRLWVFFSAREKPKPKSKAKPKPTTKADAKPKAEPKAKSKTGEDPLAASFSPGSVTRIVAAGNVRISGEGRVGEAEIAVYDPVKRVVKLAGKKRAPVIHDGENYLTAPLILYHLASGRLESPNGPFKIVVREKKPGSAKPPGSK
jgi:lipopolysaccharide export system protein LptA